jgi:response regulator RpfG family c-di-GMP phosphodiesterase
MSQSILIFESDEKFYEIYELNLRTYLGCDVDLVDNPEQALDILKHKTYDVVICRTKFLGENMAKLVLDYLKDNSIATHTIALGSSNDDFSQYPCTRLANGIKLQDIVRACADALNVTALMMAKLKVDDYFPIPINYFTHIQDSIVDVFEKYGEHYNVMIPQFTAFNIAEIEKAKLNGQTQWYVKKENRLKMVNYITSSLISNIDFHTLEEDDQMGAQEVAQKLVSIKLRDFGVTEDTIRLGKMAIRSMAKSTIKTKKIGDMMKKLISNKASYLFKHIQLATFFGFNILQNIDWGNKEQMEKLAFTAFFHDICIETDKQAMIHTNGELKAASFSAEENELVNKHAQCAAGLVNQMSNAPMGVDQIIRQHHGTLNGIGYSDNYSANISPLALVFMLSEETGKILLTVPEGSDPKDFLIKTLREKFKTQRFKKYIDIIEKLSY